MAVVSERLQIYQANNAVVFTATNDCIITIIGNLFYSNDKYGDTFYGTIILSGTTLLHTVNNEQINVNISGLAIKKGDSITLRSAGDLRIQGVTL